MIDIANVDAGAMVKQVFRNFHRGGEVERRLAVAAAGVNQRGIGIDPRTELVQHTETRRGVDRDDGAAFDGIGGELGAGAIEKAESARPPLATRVDIGAGVK